MNIPLVSLVIRVFLLKIVDQTFSFIYCIMVASRIQMTVGWTWDIFGMRYVQKCLLFLTYLPKEVIQVVCLHNRGLL